MLSSGQSGLPKRFGIATLVLIYQLREQLEVVSINDVALRAGVSPTTVSHALSGRRKVGSEVYERVMNAVAELNYTPSRSAQSLAKGQTMILGLVVPDISNSFFAELARGVEKSAFKSGYNVLLSTTGFDHDRERHALEMIQSKAIDGLIYAAGAPPALDELVRLSEEVPMVLVDEELPALNLPSISSNNFRGGQLVASHLLERGHRSAVVLEGGESLLSSERRVEGFGSLWSAKSGNRMERSEGGFTYEGGKRAILPFVDRIARGELTAVFATNDLMAIGALEVLLEAGISVPDQVSVVGFDDIYLSSFVKPGLTTIRQDVMAMGEVATDWLLTTLKRDGEALFNPNSYQQVLPVSLIDRESAAEAPVERASTGTTRNGKNK